MHVKSQSIGGNPHFNLIVKDSGKGIPKGEIPHVFDRFYQVDTSDIRQSEGRGIGFALVKELAHLMGGLITVESILDEGKSFNIQIP